MQKTNKSSVCGIVKKLLLNRVYKDKTLILYQSNKIMIVENRMLSFGNKYFLLKRSYENTIDH